MKRLGWPAALDRFASAKAVADSVLYEGYVLYPYRASARKNKFRWQFGLLYPQGIGERSSARCECIVKLASGPSEPVVHVRARWLRAVRRDVEVAGADGRWSPVEEAEACGQLLVSWDEGQEEVVDLPPLELTGSGVACCEASLKARSERQVETVPSWAGELPARLVRRAEALSVKAYASCARAGDGHFKVSVELVNETLAAGLDGAAHNERARRCLIGAHIMLCVDGGEFLSAIAPLGEVPERVACHSDGLYPVLVGDATTVLAAPIILYDFPSISPETPGDFFDATEIDEILGLRVLTLTEEEKSEARATDELAAAVVDHCEAMGPVDWARLHGAMRPLGRDAPVGHAAKGSARWEQEAGTSVAAGSGTVRIAGVEVRRGCKVRLVPNGGADVQDMFLAGRVGTVEGVFEDLDGRQYLGVSIDGDPAAAELGWQGRHYYFSPDEVEPLEAAGK